MAGLLGNSLGAGIGLSATPELYSGIAEQSKERALARRAQQDQKKKEADLKQTKGFDDYMKSIEVKGLHPIYEGPIKEKTAEVLQLMQKKREEDPYGNWTNDADLKNKIQELKFSYQDYKHGGDELDKDFQELRVHPKDYDIDGKLLDAVKQNDYQKFTQILKDKGYSDSDLYTGGLLTKKEIPFDKDKPINALMPVVKTIEGKKETPEGGSMSSVKDIDMTATEQVVDTWLDNNPDYITNGKFKTKEDAKNYIMQTQILPKVNASKKYETTEKDSSKTVYGVWGGKNKKYSFKHGPMHIQGKEGGQGNEITFQDVTSDATVTFGATVQVGSDPAESVEIKNPALYTGDDPKSPDAKWMVSGMVKKTVPVLTKQGMPVMTKSNNGQQIPKHETKDVPVRIPYDQVAPEMKAKFDFDLPEYVSQADFGEQKKQQKNSGGSYVIKGKNYSLKDLEDLGYTEDQVAKYKK